VIKNVCLLSNGSRNFDILYDSNDLKCLIMHNIMNDVMYVLLYLLFLPVLVAKDCMCLFLY